MANRSTWKFIYKASDLLAPATTRLKYHERRGTYWKNQIKEIDQKIRSEGLSLEDFEEVGKFANSTYAAPQVKVDVQLAKSYQEAVSKLREHTSASTTAEGWLKILTAHRDHAYELDFDDWQYFFNVPQ